jgi:hypothetical protein
VSWSDLDGARQESERAAMNAAVAKMLGEANRRDLDEIARARHLDSLGVRGHVAFGFYVEGFGDAETGSLCDVAVTPTEVIFLDADASAAADAELGRAPRDGLTLEASSFRSTLLPQEFPDAPWTIRSMEGPGAVDLRGRAEVRWPAGRAIFAFATPEGAAESCEQLRRFLAAPPEM